MATGNTQPSQLAITHHACTRRTRNNSRSSSRRRRQQPHHHNHNRPRTQNIAPGCSASAGCAAKLRSMADAVLRGVKGALMPAAARAPPPAAAGVGAASWLLEAKPRR
jgi:hypothetical protein